MKKACLKCGAVKPLGAFNFKNKIKKRRNSQCKQCTREAIRAAYNKNRKHYLAYRARYNKELIRKKHKIILDYLTAHPRKDCGIQDPRVLQFDHVRGEKVRAVSELVYRAGFSLRAVVAEIDKCEIRCANCHAIKTATERGYYSRFSVEKELTEETVS